MRRSVGVAFCSWLGLLSLHAGLSAQAFRALDARDSALYRFNFQRNFFSDEAAAREPAAVSADLVRLQRVAEAANTSPAALLTALRTEDEVLKRFVRYQSFLFLRTVINSADTAATRAGNDIAVRAAGPLRAVPQWIADGDTSLLVRWLRTDARLRPYGFSIRQTLQNARRIRTAAAPEVQTLNQRASTWGPQLFQTTIRQIDFGQVRDSSGRSYDVRQEPNAIRNHRERSVREAGFKANIRGTATRADTFALILTNTAAMLNESARLQRASDFAELSYGQRFLSRASVEAMLSAIAAAAGTNKRYERLRRERVKAELGVEQVHTWDLTAPSLSEVPRFTIKEATAAVISAVQPLGPSYAREMSAVLAPQNGRIDLIPRPNRVERPGFSTGLVGFPSVFFQGRFEGFTEDLVIMTHEAGHAVQNMLMDSAGVLPRYAQGPSYLTESYGLFSELLILDHLARTSSGARRIFFLERLLDQASDLYRNSWESALEQAVFDSSAAGRKLDATQLEALTQSIASAYSSWHGNQSERLYAWVNPIQLYTRPLYRVNYVYGKLLALAYYDAMKTDSSKFQRQYNALLSRGYDAPPADLLARSLGIEFTPEALVPRATRVIETWIQQLQSEYARR